MVINSILCALNEQESWLKAQKLTANRRAFIDRLINFPADQLTLPKLKKIEAYTNKQRYEPEILAMEQKELALLADWVISVT